MRLYGGGGNGSMVRPLVRGGRRVGGGWLGCKRTLLLSVDAVVPDQCYNRGRPGSSGRPGDRRTLPGHRDVGRRVVQGHWKRGRQRGTARLALAFQRNKNLLPNSFCLVGPHCGGKLPRASRWSRGGPADCSNPAHVKYGRHIPVELYEWRSRRPEKKNTSR